MNREEQIKKEALRYKEKWQAILNNGHNATAQEIAEVFIEGVQWTNAHPEDKYKSINDLDLTKILINCPEGTKLYSCVHGYVAFYGIEYDEDRHINLIRLLPLGSCYTGDFVYYLYNGVFMDFPNSELVLYPSYTERNWNNFVIPNNPKENNIHKFIFHLIDKALVCDKKGVKCYAAKIASEYEKSGKLNIAKIILEKFNPNAAKAVMDSN